MGDDRKTLSKFWHDDTGNIRLLNTRPIEGYVMARRSGAAAFAITVTSLKERFKEGKDPT